MISFSEESKPMSLRLTSLAITRLQPLRSSFPRAFSSTFSVSAAKPTRVPLKSKAERAEPRMSGVRTSSKVSLSPVFLIFCWAISAGW